MVLCHFTRDTLILPNKMHLHKRGQDVFLGYRISKAVGKSGLNFKNRNSPNRNLTNMTRCFVDLATVSLFSSVFCQAFPTLLGHWKPLVRFYH